MVSFRCRGAVGGAGAVGVAGVAGGAGAVGAAGVAGAALVAVAAAAVLLSTASAAADAQVISRLGAGGAVAALGDRWQPLVSMTGEVVSPPVKGLRGSAHASFVRMTQPDEALFRSELVGGARLSMLLGSGGLWAGGDVVSRQDAGGDVERPRFTVGGWRRIRGLVLSLTASRRSARATTVELMDRLVAQPPLIHDTLGRIDTVFVPPLLVRDTTRRSTANRWAETEATLFWDARRWSASLAVGGRLASRGIPRAMWVSADVAVPLARPVSLVLGASAVPGGGSRARLFPTSEHRYVTIGLRIAPRFFRSPAVPAPSAALATTFRCDSIGAGRYRFELRVPGARSVDLSGDFTGWKAVSLGRIAGDRWAVTLPVAVGTHRLNIRIDGGPWVAPPGMTTMSDDYAGEVGLLVIDGTSARHGERK